MAKQARKRPKVAGRAGGVPMSQRTADKQWLEAGGLSAPHTVEGVAAAKRLVLVNSVHRDALRRYLMTVPADLKPVHASAPKRSGRGQKGPLGPDGWPLSTSIRTVGGGLPGHGKRR